MRATSRGVGGGAGGTGGGAFRFGVFPGIVGDEGEAGECSIALEPPGEAVDFCRALAR